MIRSWCFQSVTWWAKVVSNHRPPACKAGALPLSYSPINLDIFSLCGIASVSQALCLSRRNLLLCQVQNDRFCQVELTASERAAAALAAPHRRARGSLGGGLRAQSAHQWLIRGLTRRFVCHPHSLFLPSSESIHGEKRTI